MISRQCSEANMKLPGPDHPIAIARNTNRVRVMFAGNVIADTTRALTLQEASYPPVHYIPRADPIQIQQVILNA